MRRAGLITSIIIGFVMNTSCEKEADPIDFVDPDAIEASLGIDTPTENRNIPSIENPIFIGTVNNEPFDAIGAQLVQETVNGEIILTISIIDSAENQLNLTIINPETRTYAIGVPGTPSFDAEYVEASTGDGFITMQTATSNSSTGSLRLEYNANESNNVIISAQFTFTAFVETTGDTPPNRFVEFEEGNLVELPVTIIN